MNSFQLRMIKLAFVVLLYVHTNACLQLAVAILQGDSGTSWLNSTGLNDLPSASQVGR